MSKKAKEVRVDNASFNADHAAGMTEQQFIDAHMSGVPDNIGDDAAKTTWLKEAYTKVVPGEDKVASKEIAQNPAANTVKNEAALEAAEPAKGKTKTDK